MKQMKPEEINQFVQNIMGKMFNSPFPHQMRKKPEEFMAISIHFKRPNESKSEQQTELQLFSFRNT